MNQSSDELGARTSLRLEGAPNFRDLAGLTTIDGRRVRPRLLFRSEGPAHFNANDANALRSWVSYCEKFYLEGDYRYAHLH